MITHFRVPLHVSMIPAVFLALLLLMGCESSTLEKASEYISAGMFDEAITILRLEIQERPTNAKAHFLLGEALISMGNVDSGKEEFSRAVGLKKGYTEQTVQAYFRAAERHLSAKNYRMGQYCLDQAVAQDRSFGLAGAELISKVGMAIAEESPSASHTLLIRAAELDPSLLEIPDFAFLCKVQTEPEGIKRSNNAKRLLEEFPDHPRADHLLLTVGDAEFLQGNLKEAKTYYERLLEKYPSSPTYSHVTARLESIKHPRITARVSNADDKAVLYVNGKEVIRTEWGKGEGGRSVGRQPGNSGWVDITDHLHPGTNELRLWVWNARGCCGVSGTFEVRINNTPTISRVFKRKDSQSGVKYNETLSFTLP